MLSAPDAERWQNLALQTRLLAKEMTDPVARRMMLELAKRYERLRGATGRAGLGVGTANAILPARRSQEPA